MAPRVDKAIESLAGKRYVQKFETADLKIEVRYHPKTLRLLQNAGLEGSRRLTQSLLDSLGKARPDIRGMTFIMRIGPRTRGNVLPDFSNDLIYGNSAGYGGYQTTLQAFAFGLQERIWLEEGDRVIPLSNYQMENTYGMDPARYFVLTFPNLPGNTGKPRHLKLVLDDIVPGLTRLKINWNLPVGNYDASI